MNSRRGLGLQRVSAAAVVMAAAFVCLDGCARAPDSAPQTPAVAVGSVNLSAAQRRNIRLYTVGPSKFRNTVETTGVVDFDNDQATSVLAPFSGPVSRLLVSLGDEVKKGEPLAEVDSGDFATAIGAYQKALAIARTDRRLADLDRELLEHNGVSQREAAQAESDAIGAEADRDAALQTLVSLNIPAETIQQIRDGHAVAHVQALIRSPVTGTVVEKLITPGELLQAGTTPCFTVANLSRVWVMAQVFGSDLTSVSRGDEARVVTGIGAKDFFGKVDNIGALVDPNTRSVAVRVVVDNPGDYLKKQMYVRVVITGQESAGLLVPVAAILRDDENLPFVYLAQSDGSFARRHVTLGTRTGEHYDIADGLKTGDQIVVDGGIFVQFMQDQ
jgi:cobalt-zinc-cadmium efflux system membrane fusion protein